MGHQSYILLISSDESKQRILNAIKAHNSFYDDKTEEEINDPNFQHEVGEELYSLCKIVKIKTKNV